MMRIITGKARGVSLATLEGSATRPTSERAKEAIFSGIQFELTDKTVLDLFAGSGQMGLEAVSRGARSAVLCDSSRDAVKIIQTNAERTRLADSCEIFCSDALSLLRTLRGRRKFDFVFLDPPYALHIIPQILDALCEERLISVGSKVICETAAESGEEILPSSAGWETLKVSRYGAAKVTVIEYRGEETK